jgi:two-component system alkaline phosphatase synthesis response regulator PhoP
MVTEKILLIDNSINSITFFTPYLQKEGYEIITTNSGKEAIHIAKKQRPDLIILDVLMPEMDGIETCQHLRELHELKNTFISFLSTRNEDYSQVVAFDAGADDYIVQPIQPRLLIRKIKALLRRKTEKKIAKNTASNIKIDRESYLVIVNEKELLLPKKEFELLYLLMSKSEKVFTREQIASEIWSGETVVGSRTIDVHIQKIRKKIGIKHIKTIKGIGYKFES